MPGVRDVNVDRFRLRGLRIAIAITALAAAWVAAPCLSAETPRDTLSWHGLGALQVGMSRRQFHAAGFSLAPVGSHTPDSSHPDFDWRGCVELPLSGHPAINAQFENGLLVRLVVADPQVFTRAGIAVGAAQARVREAYRVTAAASAQKYSERRRNLEVRSRDGRHAFVFVLEADRVVEIRAGFARAVQYDDGCPC